MDIQKLSKKIKALMAKAEGTDNANEQAVFMAKADQLMEQHQISVIDLEADDPIDRDSVLTGSSGFPSWRKNLTASIALYYGCKVVNTRLRDGFRMYVYGPESCRVTAAIMTPFIIRQVLRSGSKLSKTSLAPNTSKCQRQVGNALFGRIAVIMHEQRQKDKTVNGHSRTALVRVDATEARIQQDFKSCSSRSMNGASSTAARNAAKSISLHKQAGHSATKRIAS